MSTVAINNVSVSPLEALWALFKSQPKTVRKAFTKKLMQEEVGAETMHNQMVVFSYATE